jgi:hypothetical protein
MQEIALAGLFRNALSRRDKNEKICANPLNLCHLCAKKTMSAHFQKFCGNGYFVNELFFAID